MSKSILIDKDYLRLLLKIKSKIRSTQVRAALAANSALIEFYYDLGGMIVEKQAQSSWGDKLVQQLSEDLRAEFPEMKGLSRTNLLYCKQFFKYFQSVSTSPNNLTDQIVPRLVGQLQEDDNQSNIIVPRLVGQLQEDNNPNNIYPKSEKNQIVPQVVGQLQKSDNLDDIIVPQVVGQLHLESEKKIAGFGFQHSMGAYKRNYWQGKRPE